MKITLTKLRLIISDLKNEYREKSYALTAGSTITKIKEISNNHEEILSEKFDFDSALNELVEINEEIIKLSKILAKENTEAYISDSDTIQAGLIKLQEKRKLLSDLDNVIQRAKERKIRKADGGYGAGTAYYEISTYNFDKDKLIEMRDTLKNEINDLETNIQDTNSERMVEIN